MPEEEVIVLWASKPRADEIYSGGRTFDIKSKHYGVKVGSHIRYKVRDEHGFKINHPLNDVLFTVPYVTDEDPYGVNIGCVAFSLKEMQNGGTK